MYKRILATLCLGLVVNAVADAQTFTVTPETKVITANTAGQGLYNAEQDTYSNTIDLDFHINNTSANPLKFIWTLLSDSTQHPAGWLLTGICDNRNCRSPYSDFYYHIPQITNTIVPGETDEVLTQLEARIYAPVGSANGQGIFKVKISSVSPSDTAVLLQTDTLTYIVNKNPTGISVIQIDDSRVTLSPNPATNNLHIVADKALNAKSISIVSINGAQAMNIAVNAGTEATDVNINSLATGNYMVRINDANGKMITTRKFVKK
jgi:hypothetical protein